MKRSVLLIAALVAILTVFAADPPRDPFIILKVNGKEYKNGAEISVRSGERVQVEAVLMGGKRDYCSNPQKYANIGANTVIESQGENGMSFNVNQGQFRGDWKLVDEKAVFSSGPEVGITTTGTGNIQRTATVEFKPGNYSKVFFKVNSTTNWHYVRNTPGGRTEQDEKNTGTATFYFVIESEPGVWYSSNNIKVKGIEDFSVRNNLDRIQEFYNLIEKALVEKNFSSAQMQWNNLKNSLGDLQTNINRAKEKDKNFECEVSLLGAPSDLSMDHIAKLNVLSEKWKENYLICSGNVQEINGMLLNTQLTFSSNILRSVFKNYINWGTSIPTSAEDILTIYDPRNIFGPIDLPRKLMGWYEEAENDASILKDQSSTIQYLSMLREYYQKRVDNFIEERKALTEIINELKPVETLHSEMENYLKSNKTVKYIAKSK